ncbi:MAG TPA: GAF domain-containing sensor histidine kinase [Rhizomicrobium sp.]|nr:GAF domain-containing sensor histidine kinase [Rhizomicrobium sp.]
MLSSFNPHDFQDDLDAIASIPAVNTILEVVCRTTGMGFAAVARVTDDRWVCCAVKDDIAFGLGPGGELKVETTICDEIRDSRELVVIDHVTENPTFCNHPTPAMYGFQSYISQPIIMADGSFFGTLCAIDPRPNTLNNPAVTGMFKLFADLIAFHLDTALKLRASEQLLLTEREGSELREQFIAVLGHDLRNPLAAIDAGTRLLQKTPLNERATAILGQMQASVHRMSGLITNVLDFARGRLGGGLVLERKPLRLEPMLDLVVAELRATVPERRIETDFTGLGAVNCDAARIGQMLSNLLGNALAHGAAGSPVWVHARSDAGAFILAVTNLGEPIPDTTIALLFQPFFRASARPNQQGLGLGLYIASEIARAHGGTLAAQSAGGKTDFTFRMPLA